MPEDFGPGQRPYGPAPIAERSAPTNGKVESSEVVVYENEPQRARGIVYVGGVLIGAAIPLGTLVLGPDTGGPSGATPALNVVIAAVAVSYLVLAVSSHTSQQGAGPNDDEAHATTVGARKR